MRYLREGTPVLRLFNHRGKDGWYPNSPIVFVLPGFEATRGLVYSCIFFFFASDERTDGCELREPIGAIEFKKVEVVK